MKNRYKFLVGLLFIIGIPIWMPILFIVALFGFVCDLGEFIMSEFNFIIENSRRD